MTNLELVLNMLAEATTSEISKAEKPIGFDESLHIARRGGAVAGNTRKEIEKEVGKSVISSANAKKPELLDETKSSLLESKNPEE